MRRDTDVIDPLRQDRIIDQPQLLGGLEGRLQPLLKSFGIGVAGWVCWVCCVCGDGCVC